MGVIISIDHLSPFALFYLARRISENINWVLLDHALEKEICSTHPQFRFREYSLARLYQGLGNAATAEDLLISFFELLVHYQLPIQALQYALKNIGMEDIANELAIFQILFLRYRRPRKMKKLVGWWSSFFGWL